MAKRSKWLIQKTKVIPASVRDSEFAEILAELGRLIYDEFSSPPDSESNLDKFPSYKSCEIASATPRKKVANAS